MCYYILKEAVGMVLRYIGKDTTLIYGGVYNVIFVEKGLVKIGNKKYPLKDFIKYTLGVC